MKSDLLLLLTDIELELRQLQCWDSEVPSVEALASTQPFCIDTLAFYQWLQWVFIPRLTQMAGESVLPQQCGIAPMAEEWGRCAGVETEGLVNTLVRIDQLLSGVSDQGQ